jgi:site-specific DNA-methyltransferase (adenine-specific)
MLDVHILAAMLASVDALIIEGDSLNLIQELPAGLVDLTITDPPYESINRHRAIGTTTRLKAKWYESIPNACYDKLLADIYALNKKDSHFYMFCDWETEQIIASGWNPGLKEHVFDIPPVASSGFAIWPTLTWIKSKQEGLDDLASLEDADIRKGMGYHWRRCTEKIMFLEKGKKALKVKGWGDVLIWPMAARDDFPSRKPDNVLTRLIVNSTDSNELVFDPFAGSGSTGKVAVKLGRKALLIEKYITEDLKEGWPKDKKIAWIFSGGKVFIQEPTSAPTDTILTITEAEVAKPKRTRRKTVKVEAESIIETDKGL